jgi:hypothetical protein
MTLKESIRKRLNEAMGVPDNIVDLSRKLFGGIVSQIPEEGYNLGELDGTIIELKDKFLIGDYKFKGVKFTIEVVDDPTMDIYGMSTRNLSKVTKKFKIKTKVNHDILEISIMIAGPDKTKSGEFKKFLQDRKVEIMGSIAHELKHYYDNFKKSKQSLVGRAKYRALTANKFGSITPLNEFMHHMYFIHRIENLVRPAEFAAALDAGEVTKKGFLEFLRNHSIYQKLKDIQNFTYQGLRDSLVEYIPRIKYLFDENGIEYDGLDDEQIIDMVLKIFVINLQQWEAESVENLLVRNRLEQILGLQGKSGEFFRKYINGINFYGDNFKKYFENEEKTFRFVATNMIKKIAKLYDMARDVKNESIINWELWQKLKVPKSKIVTESKYFKKKK